MPVIAIEAAINVWRSPNEFNLYLHCLNDILLNYESGVLITNGSRKKVFSLDIGGIYDSIQTLILCHQTEISEYTWCVKIFL